MDNETSQESTAFWDIQTPGEPEYQHHKRLEREGDIN
jgi:hypothetical protein